MDGLSPKKIVALGFVFFMIAVGVGSCIGIAEHGLCLQHCDSGINVSR